MEYIGHTTNGRRTRSKRSYPWRLPFLKKIGVTGYVRRSRRQSRKLFVMARLGEPTATQSFPSYRCRQPPTCRRPRDTARKHLTLRWRLNLKARCNTCGRLLDIGSDPLSADCGGDCWGCVGELEADGWQPSQEKVFREISEGWRNPDGSPRPPHLPHGS